MDAVDDEDEEYDEPPWPGMRAMVSGPAGAVGLVVLIVVGFVAFHLVRQRQEWNSPAHTQVVCLPTGSLTDASGTLLPGPTQLCVTGHR